MHMFHDDGRFVFINLYIYFLKHSLVHPKSVLHLKHVKIKKNKQIIESEAACRWR